MAFAPAMSDSGLSAILCQKLMASPTSDYFTSDHVSVNTNILLDSPHGMYVQPIDLHVRCVSIPDIIPSENLQLFSQQVFCEFIGRDSRLSVLRVRVLASSERFEYRLKCNSESTLSDTGCGIARAP